MRKLFTSALLVALLTSAAAAQDAGHKTKPHEEVAAAADGSGTIKRGAPVGDSERVALAEVVKEPRKYAGRSVVIEGVVERVCKKEGCWMEISPDGSAGAATVRVTFGNHSFFVPKDADRMRFRAEGKFSLKTLSKEEVEHLVKDDGAEIKANPDGTADEISFVATGVELWK